MFLDNLSSSLLDYIAKNNISYEKLAHLCNVSPEFIGRIIRRKAVPTIEILERMCKHLNLSPNQLLQIDDTEELSYRSPMNVTDTTSITYITGTITYAVCPRCKSNIPRHNQTFCDCCGQKLNWNF